MAKRLDFVDFHRMGTLLCEELGAISPLPPHSDVLQKRLDSGILVYYPGARALLVDVENNQMRD